MKIIKEKNLMIERRNGRWPPNPLPGRGGAPKFFLDWLTFAL